MQILDEESRSTKSLPFEDFKPGDTVEVMVGRFAFAPWVRSRNRQVAVAAVGERFYDSGKIESLFWNRDRN